MNRKVTITLDKTIKLFATLKFEEKGLITLKPGTTVTLEETGKIHIAKDNKEYKVLRFRKNTRNYYILDDFNT